MKDKLISIMSGNRTNIIILIYALLIAAAGIYDLGISQYAFNQSADWTKVIEDYGELPGIITLLTAIFIFHKNKKHSSNARTILYSFILLYSAFILFTYMGSILLKPIGGSTTHSLIFGIVFTIISVLLIKTLRVSFSEKVFNFSKVTLLMGVFGYVLFVQPLKIIWGRIRFRDLDSIYANFTPWYIPNGINGHESFPSGHSSMGFILISFFILFRNKNYLTRFGVYSFVLIWALTVAVSRVVIGAHFLSDVIVGSMGMVFCYLYFANSERVKRI